MLIITNRQPVAGATDGAAFSSKFTIDSPKLSAADANKLTTGEGAAGWATSNIVAGASDQDIADRVSGYLAKAAGLGRRVLVYVHGNGYDFLEGLQRCQALSSEYVGIEVIGFSWPSEGFTPGSAQTLSDFDRDMAGSDAVNKQINYLNWFKSTKDRYVQAKKNAESSAVAVTRTLQIINDALAKSGDHKLGTLAIHSLGNHLFWQAVKRESADAFVSAFSNILLLAPCLTSGLQDELLAPLNPASVYVTFNKNDWVLAGAQVADGDTKLGLNPGTKLSVNPHVRYVNFEGAARGLVGHRYFIDPNDMAVATTKRLFERTFAGEDDLLPGEDVRRVYPFGCDVKRKVCEMGFVTDDSMPGS